MAADYRATRFACYFGFISQAIVNNLAPLLFIVFQTDFALSYKQLGGLVLINFIVQLAADAACIKLVDKTGYRAPLVAANALCAAGLVMLGVLPMIMRDTYAALLISVVVYAIGGGLLEVLVSPVVDSLPCPPEEKAASMSLLHSFYCWGQMAVVLLTTGLLAVLGMGKWYLLPVLWALLPLWNAVRFAQVPMTPPLAEDKAMGVRALFRSPAFFILLILMLSSGASEQTLSQWASLFAERSLGLPKAWGDVLCAAAFALSMAVGRTIFGVRGSKMNLRRFMYFCGALSFACYLGAALSKNPALSLICFSLSGFAVSIMWPGTFSLASAKFPMGGTAMFAMLAMMGDMGCSSGPWLAGMVADSASSGGFFARMNELIFGGGAELSVGLLTGAIFPVLLLIGLFMLGKTKETS